jgi:hypothetical protein
VDAARPAEPTPLGAVDADEAGFALADTLGSPPEAAAPVRLAGLASTPAPVPATPAHPGPAETRSVAESSEAHTETTLAALSSDVPMPVARPTTLGETQAAARIDTVGIARAHIVVHHSAGNAAAAETVAGRLEAAGAGQVEIREVGFEIRSPNARYFHADDAPIARDAAVLARAVLPTSDFTHFEPAPEPGTIGIYLGR